MKVKIYILLLFPIVTFSQLSEKVNIIYQELNTKKQIESQNIGYSGAESQVYLLYSELDKIATDSEVLFMAENGNNVVKNYMSAILVDRKSNKILDLFKTFIKNEEEVHIQTGCMGYNSTIVSQLYSYIFYQNKKIENIKFNKKNYTLKEIKEYQFEIETKWTKKEINNLLKELNFAVLDSDELNPISLNIIFNLNNYKFDNYDKVKYFANKYPSRETLATLANFQNKNDLELFHQNIDISFLAISKFPDESFIKTLQNKEIENLENLDYYEAISSICADDINQIKKNIFDKLSKSDNMFTQEYVQYLEEALKKYSCEFNSHLLLEIEKFHNR
ncbi:hypothetical protein [Flavobacterium chungnamense]|uniref:Periplasmic protein n=1 Tax=Flavobacterium chungnamense TaxID=706182 RepID=A0ABP7UCD7_9FLAO